MNKEQKVSSNLSLAGEWFYRLDPNFLGEMRQWYREDLTSDQVICFPNTLDTAGIGFLNTGFEAGRPMRKRKFEGCAWFQKKVTIPEEWRETSVTLFMERCSRSSRIWVDGIYVGKEDSISTPHEYDLSHLMTAGDHVLTIEVENAYARSYGAGVFIGRWSSAICDDLHTNWLGILGRFELISKPLVSIRQCRILSSLQKENTAFRVEIQNNTNHMVSGEVSVKVYASGSEEIFQENTGSFATAMEKCEVILEVPMNSAQKWDECIGNLYLAKIVMHGEINGKAVSDHGEYRFGYREFSRCGTQFVLNGDTIFLRGSVEYTGFAETGHPPVAERHMWEKIFRTSKEYGFNHYRFHSYCPPEIAFCVADELGMLLHVEVPVWTEKPGYGEQPELLDFIEREARRIISQYYNHPSFVMLGLGNEYQSHFEFLDQIIYSLKMFCPDKLYTFTTNFVCDGPTPESDYFISSRTASGMLRINSASADGRFQGHMDGTNCDYDASVKDVSVPVVVHELGQWTTYPDYTYLEKYRNTIFEPYSVKELSGEMSKNGLKEQNQAFQQASGKFSWIIYKEEIEKVLRTRGMGGFQLLSLADSPGWGEAFTGALDPFWDPKPFLTASEVRCFCNDIVLLMRMDRFVYSNSDTFCAVIQAANYSHFTLKNKTVEWILKTEDEIFARGEFLPVCLKKGELNEIGEVIVPLIGISQSAQLSVEVRIPGTEYYNHWNIWVYPEMEALADDGEIYICRRLDDACERQLEAGKDVLYLAGERECAMRDVRFLPVFWSLWWFWWNWRDQPVQPATMGILCDPEHPVFSQFPTAFHSDYQWWDILEKSKAFLLPADAKKPEVLLQLIDDYHINAHLASLVQARIGKGRLIACSLDFVTSLEKRPAAKQLYKSLIQYMKGDTFEPSCTCTLDELKYAIQYRQSDVLKKVY